MSEVYDNWERLVAAVLRREELWQLCYATSRSPSISSESSSFSTSSSSSSRLQFDNSNSTNSEVERNRNSVETESIGRNANPVELESIRRKADPVEPERINPVEPERTDVRNISRRDGTRNATTYRTQKVVLKLDIYDDRSKQKALKRVCCFSGVDSMALDTKSKKLTIIGEVDAAALTISLRKLFRTEIMSVGPVIEPELEAEPEPEPEPEPKKKEPWKGVCDYKKGSLKDNVAESMKVFLRRLFRISLISTITLTV